MSPVEAKYKSELIDRIKSIQDRDILDEVNRLLKVNIEETVYRTSPKQKQEIEEARAQIAAGQGIPSEEADREIEKCLLK